MGLTPNVVGVMVMCTPNVVGVMVMCTNGAHPESTMDAGDKSWSWIHRGVQVSQWSAGQGGEGLGERAGGTREQSTPTSMLPKIASRNAYTGRKRGLTAGVHRRSAMRAGGTKQGRAGEC